MKGNNGSCKLRTQRNKKAFLSLFPDAYTVTETCKLVKIETSTFYDWLKADPEFKANFERAKEQSVEILENEARRRAFEGWEEPSFHVVDKQLVTSPVRRFSDVLLIFLLKGARPEKYRDRWEGKVTGDVTFKVVYETELPSLRELPCGAEGLKPDGDSTG